MNIVLVGRETESDSWGYFGRYSGLNSWANASNDADRPARARELHNQIERQKIEWQKAYAEGHFLIVDTDREKLPWQFVPIESGAAPEITAAPAKRQRRAA